MSKPDPRPLCLLQSHFSLMWGPVSLERYADALLANGHQHLILVDRGPLVGMVRQLNLCLTRGLIPIIGCELLRGDDQAFCLVRTEEGFHHCCHLLTALAFQPDAPLWELAEQHYRGMSWLSLSPSLLQLAQETPDWTMYLPLSRGTLARARDLARQFSHPLLAVQRVMILNHDDWQQHRLLQAIAGNTTLAQLPPWPSHSHVGFPRQEEARFWGAFPEATARAQVMLEEHHYVPRLDQRRYPDTTTLGNHQTLRELAFRGALQRLGTLTNAAKTRLERELDRIERKGFEAPFLIAADVVRQFPITCGRGSAAASLVAYCLGITHVDPLQHQLMFERFLSEGRLDPPDIDIDFPWDERDQVRLYLCERFGRDHVALVANLNHFQQASALQETAKVFGFGPRELTLLNRQLSRLRRFSNGHLAMSSLPEGLQEVMQRAMTLVGHPRELSVHCGGVIIAPNPLLEHAPLLRMPIGFPTLPWNKDDVEAYGFIKLDFLGNRSLAVIRDTLAQRHPERVGERYRSLNPLLEKATQQDIARGDTMGCFYIESPATRQLLQKTAHGDYETLVAVSSIIRPAANTIAETWVHRHRHMKRPGATPNWRPIHPLVEQALEETHGLMVYQEDVTRVATAAAGFTSDEGNLLRKIMAKKTPATLQLLYQRFCQGCQARGLNAGQIRQVWQMIESFSGYSFCKPHSASYALVSFKAVALKHQHPATFLAAVVANRGGFYSPYAYLSQARRSGITLKPCDINHSQRATQGEDHPPRHLIRLGLDHIKGLHQETLSLILSARQQRPFDSLQEFLQRLNIPRGDVQRLIFSGCFDDLHPKLNRPTLWFQALCFYGAPERGSQLLAMNTPGQPNLPLLPALSLWQRHQQEQELWGFPLSTHPLFFWRPHFPELTRRAIDLVDHAGDTLTLLGVLIAGKITRTRQGEAMGFFTFEDETGLMECVAFPSCYRQCALHLHHLHCFRLKGRVTAHLRTLTLHLDQVEPLQATTPLLASSG